MGTSCPKLKATPKNVSLTGKDQANIADYVSMKNVPSFGRCRSLGYPPTASATAANHGKLTPMPCVPGTCPKWKTIDKDSLICGEPALLKPATLKCMYGGTISIVDPGQTLEIKVNIPIINKFQDDDIADENLENEVGEEKKLTFSDVLDGIQLTLDLAGFAPGVGAIPDLANAAIYALRGKWIDAGLSIIAAVPIVGDLAAGVKIAKNGVQVARKAQKSSSPIELIKCKEKFSDSNIATLKKNNGKVEISKAKKKELSLSSKQYVSKDISPEELKAKGICKTDEEVDFFNRSLKNERKKEAYNFYKSNAGKNAMGETEKANILSHINGIDLSKPVIVKEIPPDEKPMKLYRYIRRKPDGSIEYGNYFTDNPNAIPNDLGITNTYGKGQKTLEQHDVLYTDFKDKKLNKKVSSKIVEEELYEVELVEFIVNPTNKVKCLQSTAAPIKAPKNADWNDKAVENMVQTGGGGTQYYISMNGTKRRNISKTAKKVNDTIKNSFSEQKPPKEVTTRTINETYDFTKK